MISNKFARLVALISIYFLVAGCGGGGGSGGGSGTAASSSSGAGSGSGSDSGSGASSGRLSLKSENSGVGSPFVNIVIDGLESQPGLPGYCPDTFYADITSGGVCWDKRAGFFKGPPPSPALAVASSGDYFAVKAEPSTSLLGSGLSYERVSLDSWRASGSNYFLDPEAVIDLDAGQSIVKNLKSEPGGMISNYVFRNVFIALNATDTPFASAQLTISVRLNSGATVNICSEIGAIQDLQCFVDADDVQFAANGVAESGHFIQITAIDQIRGLESQIEFNVTDQLLPGLFTRASLTASGIGSDSELSAQELSFNAFNHEGYTVRKEREMRGGWKYQYYFPGGPNATGFSEPGYRDVREFIQPHTVFIYLEKHDLTIFAHGGDMTLSGNDRPTYFAVPYFALRAAAQPDNLTTDRNDFWQVIDEIGPVRTQVYYGDLLTSDILKGNIEGMDKAGQWSEAKTTQIIGARPAPSAGGGGSSATGVDALGGAQTNYTYQCDTPGSSPVTLSVTAGSCKTQQQNYARVFGCNNIDNFYAACTALYSCASDDSTGEYREYYEAYFSTCDYYRN